MWISLVYASILPQRTGLRSSRSATGLLRAMTFCEETEEDVCETDVQLLLLAHRRKDGVDFRLIL